MNQGREIYKFGVAELTPLLNLRPFMQAWMLPPSDATLWAEPLPPAVAPHQLASKQLLDDARLTLTRWQESHVHMTAAAATLPATADGDDIILTLSDSSQLTFPCLRNEDSNRLALSDFVTDRVTVFCTTSTRALRRQLAADPQSYEGLMADLLLTRLAEAAAELLHRRLTFADPPVGIRPAIGYPSLPDHSLMKIADRVLDFGSLDMEATAAGALTPPASTAGLIIANPEATYFSVGAVSARQLESYARRSGTSLKQLAKSISLKQI